MLHLQRKCHLHSFFEKMTPPPTRIFWVSRLFQSLVGFDKLLCFQSEVNPRTVRSRVCLVLWSFYTHSPKPQNSRRWWLTPSWRHFSDRKGSPVAKCCFQQFRDSSQPRGCSGKLAEYPVIASYDRISPRSGWRCFWLEFCFWSLQLMGDHQRVR